MDKVKCPEIRFEGFSGDWEEKKLGDVMDYKNGKGHENKQKSFGKFELVNLNSISIDGGLKPSGKFIDEADITLEKNDLVMVLSDVAHGNLLGRVAIIPENNLYVLNQRVALLRPNNDIHSLFILYNINAHQLYFKSQGAGMSQLNISRGCVESFSLFLPNKKEQTAIGNFFQQLDQSIVLQQQKYTQTQNLKKAMLEKMFPKAGRKQPEIRLKGFGGDWEEFKLGQIYGFNYGEFNTNPSNGGQYQVYGANGIIGGYTSYNAESSAVIGHMGEYAGSVLWAEGKHFVTYNGTIAKPKKSDFNSLFGYFALVKMNLKKVCGGSGQPFLSYDALERLDVLFPTEKEQTAIGQFFKQLDDTLALQQQQLQTLKNLKQAFLGKMFV